MYDFLRRPAWIVSHVLVAALIVLAVVLGFWQRSRYFEENGKQDRLDELAARPPVPYGDVVDADESPDAVDPDVEFTRVEVTGRYDTDAEVAILNRSNGGAPGAWVLTPLVQADGTAVAVVRGWIPYDPAGTQVDFPDAAPPTGEVTVTGLVQLTQERGSLGPVDAPDGTLQALARVDVGRYGEQLDEPLAPAWVLLDGQAPPQEGDLPSVVVLQAGDSGQNFGYMVQWWIFALIGLIGYPLILRRVARNRARGEQVPTDDATSDVGARDESVGRTG